MQNFFTIARWTHGEVQPDGAPGIVLYQQFVERLPTLLTDIEQDGGIADELTDILHPDINGAAGEVVAGGHATHGSVHLEGARGQVHGTNKLAEEGAMYLSPGTSLLWRFELLEFCI